MVSPTGGPVQGTPPAWTVAAVARRIGVAPATLRSWSRRYGIGPAGHQAGRYRRYTDADVAELETMRRLAGDGMVLASAATLARERHRAPCEPRSHLADSAASDPGGPVGEVSGGEVHDLMQAARRLEVDTLLRALESSLAERGVAATWDQLCRPALTALDGPSGTACTDAALVLAWAATTSLRHRFPVSASPSGRVLLACAAGEHHTLALEALLAALTEHDVPAQILGPAVPTSALLHAVEQSRPRAVLVWAQRAATAHPSVLRRLRPHTDVAAAGPGWSSVRLPAGLSWVNTLDDAVHLARHTASAPDTSPRTAATG